MKALLDRDANRDLLRFITCGSVDDGKSTLIGRLLHESQQVLEDQAGTLQRDSRKWGTTGDEPDLALLVDGLQAEREQGITIDVAWRYFSTARRKFIIADTPGHEQYTRNMVTAATTADAAVILIDASQGLKQQTRRHLYIASLLGIHQLVLAINKMDLVDYSSARFEALQEAALEFAGKLDFDEIHVLPMAALSGANVTNRGAHLAWFQGPSLLEQLERLPTGRGMDAAEFRLPVQYVNRPDSGFRGYAGTISSGRVRPGDVIMTQPSGRKARVERIVTMDGDLDEAAAGQAVTLTLDEEIDVSRGDLLVHPGRRAQLARALDAHVVWMVDQPLRVGRPYELKIGTRSLRATAERIHHRIDINDLEHHHADQLEMNEVGLVRWRLSEPAAFDPYRHLHGTGSFIVIDRISNATAAGGMIVRAVTDALTAKSSDVVWHELKISKTQRSAQKAQQPVVLWFTGLSGAGKSSIANAVEQALFRLGHHSYLLDGDNVRHGLSRDLGFTDDDRVENIRRIGEVARLMADAGLVVLTAFISPFRSDRAMVRSLMEPGEFVEIHVQASLEACEARDPKGLYAKARAGSIRHFTGIDSPYEPPSRPEIIVDTEQLSVEESVDIILDYLNSRGILG